MVEDSQEDLYSEKKGNEKFTKLSSMVSDGSVCDFLVSKTNDDDDDDDFKHSKDISEPQEASSNGTTTPTTTDSNNSSPVSDILENKSTSSDKADLSSDGSTTIEKTKNDLVTGKPRLKYSRVSNEIFTLGILFLTLIKVLRRLCDASRKKF